MRGINDIRITFEEKINKYAVKQIQPHMINALAVMLCDEAVNETLFSLDLSLIHISEPTRPY